MRESTSKLSIELLNDIEKLYSLSMINGISAQTTNVPVLKYLEKIFQDLNGEQVVRITIMHPFFKNDLMVQILQRMNQENFVTLKQNVFLMKILSFSLLGEYKKKNFQQEMILNQLKKNLKTLGEKYTKEILSSGFIFQNFAATYYKFIQSENDLYTKEKQIQIWDERNKILKEKTLGVIPTELIPLEYHIKRELIPEMIDPIITFSLLRNKNLFNQQMIESMNITEQLDFLLLTIKNRYPLDVNILKSIIKSCENQLSEQKNEQLIYQQRWSLQLNLSHLAELGLSNPIPQNQKQISLRQICDIIWALTSYYNQEHEIIVRKLINQAMLNLNILHLNDLINLLYGTIIYTKFQTPKDIKGIFSYIQERFEMDKLHSKSGCLLYQIIRYIEIIQGRDQVSELLDSNQYQQIKTLWTQSRYQLRPQQSKTEKLIVDQILQTPLKRLKYTRNAYVQNLYYVDLLFPAQRKLQNNIVIEIDSDLHDPKIYNPQTRQYELSYKNGNSILRNMIIHRCKYQTITFYHTEYLTAINKSTELQKLILSKLQHIIDQN